MLRNSNGGHEGLRVSKLISSLALSAVTLASVYFAVLSLLIFFGVRLG
jgi:hypothetical protein